MQIVKAIQNQYGIFLIAIYTENKVLKVNEFRTLEYGIEKYLFEVIEMETSEEGSIICYLQEVGKNIQEMLGKEPRLLSEREDFDIRNIMNVTM